MIISDILDFLSWTLPGGIGLVPVALGIFTFLWWAVWKGTKFWTGSYFFKFLGRGWILIIAVYAISWSIARPPPIPIRVLVSADYPAPDGSSGNDWRIACAVDLIEERLAVSADPFVPQSSDIVPLLKRFDGDQAAFDILADRMKVRWIVTVSTIDSTDSVLYVTLKEREWGGSYKTVDTLYQSGGLFSISVCQLVEETAKRMGDHSSDKDWSVRFPVLPDDRLESFYRARTLYKSGNIDSAANILTGLIEEYPQWKHPYQELALVSLSVNLDRYGPEARNALLTALELDSTDAKTYTLFGRYFLQFRDWDEAESFFKVALNYNPSDARNHYYLSQLFYKRLNDLPWRSKVDILQRALQLVPGYESARIALFRWYSDLFRHREAHYVLAEGLDLDPRSVRLLLADSVTELGLGNPDAAIARCKTILEIQPGHAAAWYNIGQTLLRTHHYEESIVAFDSSLANNGTSNNLYCIGLALERLERLEEALQYYRRRLVLARSKDDRTAIAARDQIRKVEWKIAQARNQDQDSR